MGVLETRESQGRFGIEFESTDLFNVTFTDSCELLTQPFPIAPGVNDSARGLRLSGRAGVLHPRQPASSRWHRLGTTMELLQG